MTAATPGGRGAFRFAVDATLRAVDRTARSVGVEVDRPVLPHVGFAAIRCTGWRLFQLLDDGSLVGPVVGRMLGRNLVHRHGVKMTALCIRNAHPAPPHPRCGCGLYYVWDRAELMPLAGLIPSDRRVYARVEVRGRRLPDPFMRNSWRAGALVVVSLHTEPGIRLEPAQRDALAATGWPSVEAVRLELTEPDECGRGMTS